MHWIGIAALVGAAVMFLRWFLRRADGMGRDRRMPKATIALLVIAGIGFLSPWYLRQRLEERLSDAVSELLGESVDVHCQSFGESFVDVGAEFGYVPFGPDGVPEKKTLIKRNQCRDLNDYLGSDKLAPTDEQVVAVHTLTHEAMHMAGMTNEAETECAATKRDADMALALGAPPGAAETLARTYWERFYPRMPDGYRSSDCTGPD